jgi:cytochrome P450 family 714 subfamily C
MNKNKETENKQIEHKIGKTWSIIKQQLTNIYTHSLVDKMKNNEKQLYKIILPTIPSNLEFRQKRAKQVLSGEAHLIYDLNKKMCCNQNYYQYTTGSVEIPTGNEEMIPSIILCKNPKEASHLLRNNISKSKFPYNEVLVGEGVLGQTDSKLWAKQKKILKPAFKSTVVSSLVQLIHYHIQDKNLINKNSLISNIRNQIIQTPQLNIYEYLKNITFIIIGNVALGETSWWLEKHGTKLREAFEIGLQPVLSKTETGIKAYNTMKEFAEHAWDISHERRKKNKDAPITIVDIISQTDYSKLGNNIINEKHRIDELMTIMFAGHETTANTLTWCLYELSKNDEAQQRIRKEIQETMKNNNILHPADFIFEQIGRMKLVNSALRESMRLWPVVANGSFRIITQNNEIIKGPNNENVILPVGIKFQVPHWTFHRDKLIWGNDADKFDLDRYDKNWNHDAFMPFSKAPRDCLGRHFAMASMRIMLIHLLYNFNFTINKKDNEKKGYNWATLTPENGLEVLITDNMFNNILDNSNLSISKL